MAGSPLTNILDTEDVRYELLPHARTESAGAEAQALGVDPGEVAKTLVLTAPEGFVRAVVPGSERIDLHKVRELLGGGKRTHLLTEDDLERAYPEFELGAVPPFGGERRDRVLLDRRLAERDSLVLEAGTHEQSVRISTADLRRLSDAEIVDLCEE